MTRSHMQRLESHVRCEIVAIYELRSRLERAELSLRDKSGQPGFNQGGIIHPLSECGLALRHAHFWLRQVKTTLHKKVPQAPKS